MAKIFISMSGEGRGHATRIRSLTELLRSQHEVVLFAPGDAYDFLEADYAQADDVRLVKIPGLKFHYARGRLSLFRSIYEGLMFERRQLPKLVSQLAEQIAREKPDLILTDFEPSLPRAAKRQKRPFLSLTHQHFLLAYDLSWLPWSLRLLSWITGLAIPLHYTGQKVTMISSFFLADLKPNWQAKGAVSVGPMIRPELRTAAQAAGLVDPPQNKLRSNLTASNSSHPVHEGEFLLSYLRRQTPEWVLDELEKSGERIKIYGMRSREPRGNLTFHSIDPTNFVNDLISCKAVVSAAGNQLLGECMYLGKPVLAIPEGWHQEQLVNANFLRKMGCGEFVVLERFRKKDLELFLEKLERYQNKIRQTCLGRDGTWAVLEILESQLATSELPQTQQITPSTIT